MNFILMGCSKLIIFYKINDFDLATVKLDEYEMRTSLRGSYSYKKLNTFTTEVIYGAPYKLFITIDNAKGRLVKVKNIELLGVDYGFKKEIITTDEESIFREKQTSDGLKFLYFSHSNLIIPYENYLLKFVLKYDDENSNQKPIEILLKRIYSEKRTNILSEMISGY